MLADTPMGNMLNAQTEILSSITKEMETALRPFLFLVLNVTKRDEFWVVMTERKSKGSIPEGALAARGRSG